MLAGDVASPKPEWQEIGMACMETLEGVPFIYKVSFDIFERGLCGQIRCWCSKAKIVNSIPITHRRIQGAQAACAPLQKNLLNCP
jgi:hypothetical protein